MQITHQLIEQLAADHGGITYVPSPTFPNVHIKLPNGATVSIGYGPGHYCSARDVERSCVDPLSGDLPQDVVEVAYWHPDVRPRKIDWDSDEPNATKPGDPGGMLPEDDVHGWQTADELRQIVATAATLTPDWDLALPPRP